DEGLGDLPSGGRVHRAVETDHAAEGRTRVALEGACVGFRQRAALAAAARVGVLDDSGRRGVELVDQLPGGVEIHQVVERQLLAMQLFRPGDARAGRAVDRRLLVRVLAV